MKSVPFIAQLRHMFAGDPFDRPQLKIVPYALLMWAIENEALVPPNAWLMWAGPSENEALVPPNGHR
ncbi:hypothetical protein [Candidatus Chloroploca sp. Khr17]|uniref:hypothetical protein n=1 Tax=Candidatus Chloroploca sp. Khr17 TaxID=2496869 RepID=UPI00101CE667|nr:hypothetical protein [Candidatus Chloroploca sp. Khr17]